MQPNAAFSGSRGYFDIRMLGEFAYTANSKGVGVEIETDEPHVFRDDTKYRSAGKNYESYLFYGYKTGYMNALKTYYQGAGPGTLYDFCYADTASEKGKYLRSLYDLTYRFIKGNYSNEPPKVSIDDFGVEPDSRRNAVAIEVEDGDSRPEDIRIDIKTEPEHGYAGVAAGNKELIYTPEKGFSGADSFVITVSDGFNEPVEKTVAVFVGAQKDDETSTAEEPGGKKAFPGALIAAFACAAAALAAVAAVLLKRRKKKA